MPRGLIGAGRGFRFLTRGGLQVAQVGEVRQQGLEALELGGTAKNIASENERSRESPLSNNAQIQTSQHQIKQSKLWNSKLVTI